MSALVLSRFLKTENHVSRYMKGPCFITVRNDSCIDTWIDSRIVYQLFPRNLLLNYPKWIDSRFLRVRIDSALIDFTIRLLRGGLNLLSGLCVNIQGGSSPCMYHACDGTRGWNNFLMRFGVFQILNPIFTCGEVRARRSRDNNRTSRLIDVKEAIGYCNQILPLLCDSVV